jgi:hypothetical protein
MEERCVGEKKREGGAKNEQGGMYCTVQRGTVHMPICQGAKEIKIQYQAKYLSESEE